jgi:hypothetical protein
VFGFAPVAFGQGGVPGGPSTVITDFKTPQLDDTDFYIIPFDFHVNVGNPITTSDLGNTYVYAGWAGAVMTVHLLDNTEQDVTAILDPGGGLIGPGVITEPFGFPSDNLTSVPLTLNFWDPAALASGQVPAPLSQHFPLGDIEIHAKNTTPFLNNSDVDLTVQFHNIWHRLPCGPPPCPVASHTVTLPPSALIWVTSDIHTLSDLPIGDPNFPGFKEIPPASQTGQPDPNGMHWLHLPVGASFHLATTNGSAIWATPVNTAVVGIEHVPEPATGLLVGLGLAAVALSRRYAARRRELS